MTESSIISLSQTSPNVSVQETDISIPLVTPTRNIAMYVGEFEKGPINEPVLIGSALQFKQIFGRALDWNFNDWYQVYNYLLYSAPIWVCRTAGQERTKAFNNGNIANSPGEWGNLLTVAILNTEDYYNNIEVNLINENIQKIISEDKLDGEYLVLVFRKQQLVEFFSVNYALEIDSSYLETFNLERGEYSLNSGFTERATIFELRESSFLFQKEDYDIDIIIGNEMDNSVAIDLAEYRKDCIAFVGIPSVLLLYLLVNTEILTTEDGYIIIMGLSEIKQMNERNKQKILEYVQGLNKSQYCFFVLGIKQITDNFDNKKKLVNIAGDIAGLKASASLVNPWKVGLGSDYKIKNYEETRYYYNIDDKDLFYQNGVNALEKDIILSEKMFIDAPEEYGLLSTRNTLNNIERACEKAIRKHVFEENTKYTRSRIAGELKLILDDVLLSGGIEAGKVHVTKDPGNEEKIIINIYIKFKYLIHYVNVRVQNAGTNIIKDLRISS